MASEIDSALERALSLPFGHVTREILERLSFPAVAGALVGSFDVKIAQTRADGEIHSFGLTLPAPGGMYVLRGLVYPTTAAADAERSRADFFQQAGYFEQMPGVVGVLHFAVYTASDPLEMMIAWRPSVDADVEDPVLRNLVVPWKFSRLEAKAEPPRADGPAILAMAAAVNALKTPMQDLLQIWPDEDGPVVMAGLGETREQLGEAIAAFNAAAARCGLAHRMPLSVYDATWLPHNLGNALELESVESTVRAELARLYGPAASQLFMTAVAMAEGGDVTGLAEDYLPDAEGGGSPAVPAVHIDAFICYVWADKTRGARDVYEFVTRQGLAAWLDEEQRPATASLDAQIAAAIGRARFVLVCFSQEMFTGGGFALRELLFAATTAPERCVLVLLDRSPVPQSLAALTVVEWSRKQGREQLKEVLTARSEPREAFGVLSLISSGGALGEALLQQVRRAQHTQRVRGGAIALRAVLQSAAQDVAHRQDDWTGIVDVANALEEARCWLPIDSPLLRAEPTLTSPVVRLRFALFRALVQGHDYANDYARAFGLLEDLLALDLDLLQPSPPIGWLAEDCRVVIRDCLDAFHWAREWFLGWSPDLLADMCGVPRAAAITAQARMEQRTAVLADRMLALRLLEDTGEWNEPVISWTNIWATAERELRSTLRTDAESPLGIYFNTLGSLIDDAMVARIAVHIADGVFEELSANALAREEIVEVAGPVRIRFVLRWYRSVRSKKESLRPVLGTVIQDLNDHDATTDLTLLLSTFVVPDTNKEEWRFELAYNVLPHRRAQSPPAALPVNAPFLRMEMLSEEERDAFRESHPLTIYEEF